MLSMKVEDLILNYSPEDEDDDDEEDEEEEEEE